jgi:uncharacterized protein with PhoU and TrkA domain
MMEVSDIEKVRLRKKIAISKEYIRTLRSLRDKLAEKAGIEIIEVRRGKRRRSRRKK